jgi:hypothetical protein
MQHETRSVFAGVQLTNPFKVLYQEKEITKADLAGYYEMVADRMLPLASSTIYAKFAKNFPTSRGSSSHFKISQICNINYEYNKKK